MSPQSVEFLMKAIRRKSGLETVMLPRSIDIDTVLRLKRLIRAANSRRVKILTQMLAAKYVPRVGSSSVLKIVPKDIIRYLFLVMGDDGL
jgi:hypothetical protein